MCVFDRSIPFPIPSVSFPACRTYVAVISQNLLSLLPNQRSNTFYRLQVSLTSAISILTSCAFSVSFSLHSMAGHLSFSNGVRIELLELSISPVAYFTPSQQGSKIISSITCLFSHLLCLVLFMLAMAQEVCQTCPYCSAVSSVKVGRPNATKPFLNVPRAGLPISIAVQYREHACLVVEQVSPDVRRLT